MECAEGEGGSGSVSSPGSWHPFCDGPSRYGNTSWQMAKHSMHLQPMHVHKVMSVLCCSRCGCRNLKYPWVTLESTCDDSGDIHVKYRCTVPWIPLQMTGQDQLKNDDLAIEVAATLLLAWQVHRRRHHRAHHHRRRLAPRCHRPARRRRRLGVFRDHPRPFPPHRQPRQRALHRRRRRRRHLAL